MSELENKIKIASERAVLDFITDGQNWIQADYSNRVKLPPEFMDGVWGLVDTDKIQEQLARRVEQELADRIVNRLAAEMATDIKSILSIPERREALRAVARNHIDEICGAAVDV